MNATLFFDLDGTILNVKNRNLAVYHTVAKKMSLTVLSDEEYWSLKLQHRFPIDPEHKELFRKVFKDESEKEPMLALDTVIPEMMTLLQQLVKTHRCVLLTKRYNRDHLLQQLQRLSLTALFGAILTPHPGSRTDAVKEFGFSPQDIVIGDTEEDITTAKDLGITSIAVTWGVRNREYLQTFSPTHIVDTVEELQKTIDK